MNSGNSAKAQPPAPTPRGDSGFSIIELAVVIVIIGILVGIAVPIIYEAQFAARRSNAESTAANASKLVSIELLLQGSADTENGELQAGLQKLRGEFIAGVSSATLTVTPTVVTGDYCVEARAPGYGTAYAGTRCSTSGWQDE